MTCRCIASFCHHSAIVAFFLWLSLSTMLLPSPVAGDASPTCEPLSEGYESCASYVLGGSSIGIVPTLFLPPPSLHPCILTSRSPRSIKCPAVTRQHPLPHLRQSHAPRSLPHSPLSTAWRRTTPKNSRPLRWAPCLCYGPPRAHRPPTSLPASPTLLKTRAFSHFLVANRWQTDIRSSGHPPVPARARRAPLRQRRSLLHQKRLLLHPLRAARLPDLAEAVRHDRERDGRLSHRALSRQLPRVQGQSGATTTTTRDTPLARGYTPPPTTRSR